MLVRLTLGFRTIIVLLYYCIIVLLYYCIIYFIIAREMFVQLDLRSQKFENTGLSGKFVPILRVFEAFHLSNIAIDLKSKIIGSFHE